jgi:tetratricopeptide (TPR) repeat protein
MTLSLKKALILTSICVLTFICFRYTLHNQFTNWDDDYYVTNDPYIKAFTPHNLKVIFTEDITKNNYHPLCMLSLAVNYHFAQLNPTTYYLTNILIHIANLILVFFLFLQLCRRIKLGEDAGLFIASFGALWFGIHPMHVESVAWIAERKDVLYAFFYLLGLLTYLRYTASGKMKWYWLTFIVFIASCLSKPMAVVFPMSLLCIDFLLQRQLNKKLITEKILFFLFSLICGSLAFYTQNKTGAIASFSTLTIAERIMYAAYGFVMYISKLFNPTYLSTFYPYPYRYISGYLQGIYYAAPFIALFIVIAPTYYLYKKKSPYFRIYAFGIGFFVANIVFVLQFISVGAAIMADRYSYVAYIGLLFLIAYFAWELVRRMPSFKTTMTALLLLCSAGLAYLCYDRTYAWHDSETLLSDAIEKYPYRALLSYKWLGNYYFSIGELDKALDNYEVLATLHAADDKVTQNIAKVKALKENGSGAVFPQMSGQIKADPSNTSFKAPLDSAIFYAMQGDTLAAFRKYIAAFRINPLAEKALAENTYKLVQGQQFDQAIKQYDILLKLNTANPFYFFLRGVGYFSTNKVKPAIADWETAVRMNSKDVQQSAAYNLSVAYDTLGNDSIAIYYLNKAKNLGYKINDEYAAKLNRKYQTQQATRKK